MNEFTLIALVLIVLIAALVALIGFFWCICIVSGRCARLDERPGALSDLDHRDHRNPVL